MNTLRAGAPIGVFDSGVGGLSVLAALRAALPHEDFVYYADNAFAPYGERSAAYVIERARTISRHLRAQHDVKALVVACNTATAAAIEVLRAELAPLPIVGVEPALKPAAASSRTRHVGVLATQGTLASAKFHTLYQTLQSQARFTLQACDGLADAIERDDAATVHALCDRYVHALGPCGSGPQEIDTLVLGCTHYPFARAALAAAAGPNVQLLDTGAPVARQTRSLLATLAQPASTPGAVLLQASGDIAPLQAAARRWLAWPG